MRELFRTDKVAVRSIPAESTDRWVVTFDNFGIGHGFDRPGFAEGFLQSEGISAVHVMGAREDWYQYREMPEAMEAVRREVAGASRVMTYGSSMGGYAALRFSAAASANAVLAVSPQFSADPAKVAFEQRWIQDARRIAWRGEIDDRLECISGPVVVFDPKCDDAKHVDLLKSQVAVQSVPLPYTSHPATTFLSEVDLLKELVLATLSGDFDGSRFVASARALRARSGTYLASLAAAQPGHRNRLALSLAYKAIDVSPYNGVAKTILAKRLSAVGRHEDAIAQVADMVKFTSRDAIFLIHYADALDAAGRRREAAGIGLEVIDRLPHLAHVQIWAARLLWLAGDAEGAKSAAGRAVALDPANTANVEAWKAYRRTAVPGVSGPLRDWVSKHYKRLRPERGGHRAS